MLELAEGKWGGEGNSPVDPVRLQGDSDPISYAIEDVEREKERKRDAPRLDAGRAP